MTTTEAEYIDRLRLELKADLKDINKQLTELQIKQAVDTTKLGVLIGGITLVVASSVTVLMNVILKR